MDDPSFVLSPVLFLLSDVPTQLLLLVYVSWAVYPSFSLAWEVKEAEERVYRVLVCSLILLVDRGEGAELERVVRPLDRHGMFHLALLLGGESCHCRLDTGRPSSLVISPLFQCDNAGIP